jgi:hypothetical protein
MRTLPAGVGTFATTSVAHAGRPGTQGDRRTAAAATCTSRLRGRPRRRTGPRTDRSLQRSLTRGLSPWEKRGRRLAVNASDNHADGREFEKRGAMPEPFAGVRLRPVPEWSPGDRRGTKKRPALTPCRPSETKKPWNFQGFSRAADGTRTHDLLHGNRLDNPHKRLVLRFSPESDYLGLPAIRSLLVPQWSPGACQPSGAGRPRVAVARPKLSARPP